MICPSACLRRKMPIPRILPIFGLSKNWISRVISMGFKTVPNSMFKVQGWTMLLRTRRALWLAVMLFIFPVSRGSADKIRIGYSGATVSNAMLWVTDEGKLFQKNGIDPQILYLQT